MRGIRVAARGAAIVGMLVLLGAGRAPAEEKPARAAVDSGASASGAQAEAKNAAPPGCCPELSAGRAAARAGLDEKLAAVDRATGEAKVEAMAAVLRELVAEHGAGGCCGPGGCAGEHRSHAGCPGMGAASKAVPACCAAMAAERPSMPADCPMMKGAGTTGPGRATVKREAAPPEETRNEHGGHEASD